MADEMIQGWDTGQSVPGYYADQVLETHGEQYVITLVQRWQVADRGTAEILAATIRLEGENSKQAHWDGWDPRTIRRINADRREAGF